MSATLTALVHAESGAGKSWLCDTIPAPRLILDAEGGSQYTPSRPKALWNPAQYAPPGQQGCEPGQEQVPATTRVLVRNYQTVQRVEQWLESGNHPFKSVGIDSLTEIQKRIQDTITTGQMQTQNWGELLREMEKLIRDMRDLTMHPTNPLKAMVVVALTSEKGGKFRPHLQGQIGTTLPGFVDLVGYMYVDTDPASGMPVRRLLIQPVQNFVAKDRTDVLTETYGPVLTVRNPKDPEDPNLDFERMLAVIDHSLNG